jgi:hemerythrin-like domain-containing protein
MSKPWADKPFELLTIPGQPGAPTCSNPGLLATAIEMANVHNALLRGLNSIYLQAPYIKDPTDVADLMLYTQAWADTVHHHHSLEETIFFSRVEALAKEAGLPEGLMSPNEDQHHAFEPKIQETLEWCREVRDGKKEWDSKVLIRLIDGFAPILTQHLHDEIDTLIKLEGCDGEKVQKALSDTANEGLKTADTVCRICSILIGSMLTLLTKSLVIPQVLGCVDKTYPGSEAFPPIPFFLPYLNAYWFSRKHKGCWRFNPCDYWGKPQPLHFL